MPVVPNELNAGVWFDFDAKGAAVCIRDMPRGKRQKHMDSLVKHKTEYKRLGRGSQFQRFDYVEVVDDAEARNKDFVDDYCIVDWRGFLDEKKKEIPCTKKTKLKWMDEWPEFYQFVDECLATLQKDAREAVKAKEKNL